MRPTPIKWRFLPIFLLFTFLYSKESFSQLIISEVCASNSAILADDLGEFDDWVELRNVGDTEINLSNWRIGKSNSYEESYEFPITEDLTIAPNDYLLLWADNQLLQGETHLPFKLNNNGDAIYLYNDIGDLIISQTIALHHTNNSWGLTSDLAWKNFATPTPLSENTSEAFDGTLSPPIYNLPSGQFAESVELTISHPYVNASIYYSTNGIIPSQEDDIVEIPITVDPNSIIRAVAFHDNHISSKPSSFHCIQQTEDTIPVLSITADLYELFGFFGILNQWDSGEEISASFSYLENGTTVYHAACGLEIHAPSPVEQQGFRLSAKTAYDDPTFDFPFFGLNQPNSFDRLILRNGGDDSFELGGTFIRDQIIHATFDEIRPEHSHSSYKLVSTYLNGEYWGIHHLRERIDSSHISHHFDQHNVDLLERSAQFFSTRNILSGTWDDFDLLEEAAITLNLAEAENYNMIATWMDLSNFTDYQLMEIFISNQDWLSNNMKFWRPIDESEPWKWTLWDTDWGLGMWGETFAVGSPEWNALEFALSDWGGWLEDEIETELLQNLVENTTFRNEFASRAADLRNSSFESYRWHQRIDSSLVELEGVTEDHFERWDIDEDTWQLDLDTLRSFVDARPAIFLEHFTEQFDLGQINTLSLSTSPAGIGGFEINTLVVDSSVWSGDYFELVPVRIKALPPYGYTFVGWSDNASSETERFVNLEEDTLITALYELSEINNAAQLNEIMYASEESGDWLEIKNTSPEAIQLIGFTLSSDEAQFQFTDSVEIPANEYLIICKDTDNFDAAYPSFNGDRYEVTSLDLPNTPTTLRIRNPFALLVDSVRYTQSSPWPFQANGSGGSAEFNEVEIDNSLGNNWHCANTNSGTPGEANTVPVTISETQDEGILIAPNPFSDNILIHVPSTIGVSTINILNNQGQVVHTETTTGNSHQQLRLSHLASGCYTLVISTGKENFQRLVIKR